MVTTINLPNLDSSLLSKNKQSETRWMKERLIYNYIHVHIHG